MEFLSSEFNRSNNSYPVNLVLQTIQSESAGYDASRTGTFVRAQLPFDPSAAFHEYRFDFLPDRVVFYADGAPLATMRDRAALPTAPGHLLVSHWSNGNARWSRGPPSADATTTVRYVKAYYNSSDDARRDAYADRCADPAARPRAVCAVPSVHAAAAGGSGGGGGGAANRSAGLGGGDDEDDPVYAGAFNFFFMYNANDTVNQSTYAGGGGSGGGGVGNAAPRGREGVSMALWAVALGVVMWAAGL
jgi:hypothetical protein